MNNAQRFLTLVFRGKNDTWRYVLSGVFIVAAFFVSAIFLGIALFVVNGGNLVLSDLSDRTVLLLAGLPYVFLLAALWGCLAFLHRRPFKTLITPETRPRLGRGVIAGLVWLAILVLGDLATALVLNPGSYRLNFNPGQFFPYALLVLLLIPIQSATEELVFRGYLMQGFSLLFRYTWVPLVITSLLFGGLHFSNEEVARYGLGVMMLYYCGFGFLLGWCTLQTGGLETAIGIHIVNNLYGTLAVTLPGSSLPAPAVFQATHYDPIVGVGVSIVSGLIFLVILQALGWRRPSLEIHSE